MDGVTILIIDSSEIFRAGIYQKLSSQPGIKILECSPDQEPIKMIDSHYVDIVFLDIDHPSAGGLKIAKDIIRYYPGIHVVIFSSYFNDDELFDAIKVGASAYIDKKISTEELLSVTRKVYQGEDVINASLLSRPSVAERVLKQFKEMASLEQSIHKASAPLTIREIQILRYIANGYTNKEAAVTLGISDQTIKNHVTAILRKLNANDRAHAVAIAISNHWVALDEMVIAHNT